MRQVVTKLGNHNHPDRTDHHHCVETHQLLEIGKDTQTHKQKYKHLLFDVGGRAVTPRINAK